MKILKLKGGRNNNAAECYEEYLQGIKDFL